MRCFCLRRCVSLLLLAASMPFLGGAAVPMPVPVPQASHGAAARYLQYCQAARQRVLTPASCPFSPASVSIVVGNDPAKLAEWVNQRIAYEPYAGVVRGAEGTLAAQAGGDWDRAALLQALLAEAGYKSRLKVIERTPEEAAAVVDAYLKRPATIASWFAGVNGGEPARSPDGVELVKQLGAVPENRNIYDRAEAARVQRLVAEALDAAAHEAPRLLATLESAGKLGQPFDAWRGKLLTGAAERVEVEIDAPSGTTVLTVAPEASPADAARLSSASAIDAPPADKIARLSVRLELTAGEDGKPAGDPVKLIDRELPLGNLFRHPIRLEIVPSDDDAAAKPTATWTKAEWSKFVANFKQFQAILRVGDEWEGSKVFDTDGQIHSVSPDGRIEGATQIGGAVGRGFGGGLLGGGGDEAPSAKAKPRIESLVMTLELALPGEKPQAQQRLIYGRDRSGVTPVFTADALVTAGPVSAHATSWMLLDAVARNAPLAMRVISGDDPKRFEQTDDAVRFPVMLYDWQAIRLIAAQRLMSADAGLTFHGGPSIVLHGTHVTMPSQTEVATRHTVDVAFDGAALLPRAADKTESAARANATFGIAATVLESGLLRAIDPATGARGAYVAFEEARAAGAQPIVIAAGGDASAVKPPALVAWSLARNESGRALVFARAGGGGGGETSNAWWSVDPQTGAAIGRGDGGEGQSAIEYLQITKKNIDNLKCMVEFSNKIIRGESKKDTARQWMMCMTASDNPGSGHGIPGAVENIYEADMGLGKICDILGGAKDLYDAANMD